jgi:carbonic anhydrase
MVTADDALARLIAGNRRFIANQLTNHDVQSSRHEVANGQHPFAIVLGCADSRVPPELIFDQGLGDLFVIRVAGNIVPPSLVGSVEFAADQFGTRLVVVLGHSKCGAVAATIEALKHDAQNDSPNVQAIVERIRPAVSPLMNSVPQHELMPAAIRANVLASTQHLRHESKIIGSLIAQDGLVVVGAEYSLETGAVDFFDGLST